MWSIKNQHYPCGVLDDNKYLLKRAILLYHFCAILRAIYTTNPLISLMGEISCCCHQDNNSSCIILMIVPIPECAATTVKFISATVSFLSFTHTSHEMINEAKTERV